MDVDAHLVHFAALLRQNGISVSTGEVMDAAQAVSLAGFEKRELLEAVLLATLVKTPAHREKFERLFALYFSGLSDVFEALDRASAHAIADSGTFERAELEKLAAAFRALVPSLGELSRAALAGDGLSLLRGVRNASVSVDFSRLDGEAQRGFLSRRLKAHLGMDAVKREFDALRSELNALGISPEGLDMADRAFKAALERINSAVSEWVDQEARMRERHGEEDESAADIRHRPFTGLSKEESEAMARSVRLLADRLKTRLAFRCESRSRGRLDLRKTLRKSSGRAADGWGRLIFRRKMAVRPELAVLCDLSDSVRPTARMMLLFAMALQNMFARTRTFVFVDEVREVTERLRGMDPRRPLRLGELADVASFGGNSDYGNVFGELEKGPGRAFGHRTTLLIIGDGRSNFGDPNLAAFAALESRVGRIFWVTPEPEARWSEGDSELWRYRRHCRAVATVRNLDDLQRLSQVLFPKGGRER